MSQDWNPPLDSKEGMEALAFWAKQTGAVLQEWHERLAAKHGVSLDGIIITRKIPTKPNEIG
jgi:hypothetical protein